MSGKAKEIETARRELTTRRELELLRKTQIYCGLERVLSSLDAKDSLQEGAGSLAPIRPLFPAELLPVIGGYATDVIQCSHLVKAGRYSSQYAVAQRAERRAEWNRQNEEKVRAGLPPDENEPDPPRRGTQQCRMPAVYGDLCNLHYSRALEKDVEGFADWVPEEDRCARLHARISQMGWFNGGLYGVVTVDRRLNKYYHDNTGGVLVLVNCRVLDAPTFLRVLEFTCAVCMIKPAKVGLLDLIGQAPIDLKRLLGQEFGIRVRLRGESKKGDPLERVGPGQTGRTTYCCGRRCALKVAAAMLVQQDSVFPGLRFHRTSFLDEALLQSGPSLKTRRHF